LWAILYGDWTLDLEFCHTVNYVTNVFLFFYMVDQKCLTKIYSITIFTVLIK